jgi:phosphopentomutase
VADVAAYLRDAQPNVLFVHLTDPDAAGHRHGWMTPAYGRAVLAADASIKELLVVADRTYGEGNYSLIVTADHGGHDTNHGSADPQDVTIPWIAWGRGVHPGELTASHIRTMDTAATALWLLGLSTPPDWAGQPVQRAFTDVATDAGAAAATGTH